MARTAEGATLTRQHRQRQLALRAAVIRDLTLLWPLWTLDDFDSFDRFVAAAVPLIRARHRDAAGIAANYFRAFRTVEGIDGEVTPQIAERPPVEKVAVSMRATGLTATAKALQAGKSPQAARHNGFVRMSGAATRHTLTGAHDTIIRSAGTDRRARGWQRITSGSPCAFCAMIASRGPVFSSDGGSFNAHDHCGCTAEPVYEGSSMPGRNRRFQQLWDEATSGETDQMNAFRRAYESQTSAA